MVGFPEHFLAWMFDLVLHRHRRNSTPANSVGVAGGHHQRAECALAREHVFCVRLHIARMWNMAIRLQEAKNSDSITQHQTSHLQCSYHKLADTFKK